jgi:2-keto-4-pentenoate hydratase/2-oxohepta-3-ene-1,7-dioic acid hydratase in catechol pathway
MIFSVKYIVSYLSNFMTLYAGDVITTGTPAGVGMAKSPKIFLKNGDRLNLAINGLGEQKQKVVTE